MYLYTLVSSLSVRISFLCTVKVAENRNFPNYIVCVVMKLIVDVFDIDYFDDVFQVRKFCTSSAVRGKLVAVSDKLMITAIVSH